jgi:hypothetical protein
MADLTKRVCSENNRDSFLRLKAFDHIFISRSKALVANAQDSAVISGSSLKVHPMTYKLCKLFESGSIQHYDDRVAAIIALITSLISDFSTEGTFKRDLIKHITSQVPLVPSLRH